VRIRVACDGGIQLLDLRERLRGLHGDDQRGLRSLSCRGIGPGFKDGVEFFGFDLLPLKMCVNILTSRCCKFSRTLLTASLCMLWRLHAMRYSQVPVHSTVVNSRNSLRYILTFAFIYAIS
jgi:hypothetical protein